MKRLEQRILLAAIVLLAPIGVVNSNAPAAILAVACLASWTVLTYRSMQG
jgi:hypothetical protein